MTVPSYKTGEFRHRITFQSPVRTPDGQGGFHNYNQDYATVWAAKRELKNSEIYRHQHVENVKHVVFIIRNGSFVVNNAWKIKHKNSYYDIVNITDQDFCNQFVEITAIQCSVDS